MLTEKNKEEKKSTQVNPFSYTMGYKNEDIYEKSSDKYNISSKFNRRLLYAATTFRIFFLFLSLLCPRNKKYYWPSINLSPQLFNKFK